MIVDKILQQVIKSTDLPFSKGFHYTGLIHLFHDVLVD